MKNRFTLNYIILIVAFILCSCADIALPDKGRNISASKQCEILFKKRVINRRNDLPSLNRKQNKVIKLENGIVKTAPTAISQPNLIVEQQIMKDLFLKYEVRKESVFHQRNSFC